MEAPKIKAKPDETTEGVDRRHNSRCWEKLGPFGSGSGGLEDQRRGLHPAMKGKRLKKKYWAIKIEKNGGTYDYDHKAALAMEIMFERCDENCSSRIGRRWRFQKDNQYRPPVWDLSWR